MEFTIGRTLLLFVHLSLTLWSAQDTTQVKYVVTGRIINGAGEPVPHAQLFLEPKGTTWRGCVIEYHTADDDGRFRIEKNSAGPIEPWMLYVATPTPGAADTPISLDECTSTAKELLLTRQETDIGDVPVQIRYGLVSLRLPEEARGSLFYKDTRMALIWLRVRDTRGDIVSDGSVVGSAVNEKEMTLRIALPEGQWQAEVSVGGVDEICIPDRTLLVKYSDQPARYTLIRSKAESRSGETHSIGPDEARGALERMGIDFSEESFFERVEKGNTRAVKLFLAAGMKANVKNKAGETALILGAAGRGPLDLVQTLLEHGADVDARTKDGLTPLAIAANLSDADLVKCLIDKGSNVNAKDNSGQTPLMYAAISGRAEFVELLLAAGANIDAKDGAGNTALMHAIRQGDEDVIITLLNAGAGIQFRNKEGKTALMNAAESGSLTTVEALLNKGAKVDVRDNDGRSPLVFAVSTGRSEIVQLLRAAGSSESPETTLLYAMKRGDVDAVLSLLEKGVTSRARYADGETLLMEAAKQENVGIVRALLSKGADVNVQAPTSRRSALMEAARKGNSDIVRALLEKGARINERDVDGETALMFAASNGVAGVVKLLLDRGADAKATDNSGWTALKYAETFRHSAVVELFQRMDAEKSQNK